MGGSGGVCVKPGPTRWFLGGKSSLGIQSPCQWMIGVSNHLSKVFRFHYHYGFSDTVDGSEILRSPVEVGSWKQVVYPIIYKV